MADALSYSGAIVSAISDMWNRVVAFSVVFAASAFLGWKIHEAPTVFASISSLGSAEVTAFFKSADPRMITDWAGSMVHSSMTMWLSPMVVVYLGLFVYILLDGNLLKSLVALAILHSAHAFVFMQGKNPLSGDSLVVAVALLAICDVGTTAFLIWWRDLKENTPLPLS